MSTTSRVRDTDTHNARAEAWSRVARLGAEIDEGWTFGGREATRAQHWNMAAMEVALFSQVRAKRDGIRRVASLVRKMARLAREAEQEAAATLRAPGGWPGPQPASVTEAFLLGAVQHLMSAARAAEAAIPLSAPPGKVPRDALDRAPSLRRLPGAIKKALTAAGHPVTGATVRDLAVAVGIERNAPADTVDAEALRKKWDEAGKTTKKRSRTVAGRKRRR
jgi:hypothetical protein